jgi:hypothetical protein
VPVVEVAADPYRWQRSLEVLDGDGIPVHEFFQTAARMGPATARFYQLVVDGELAHDGGTPLARHVANAILREHSRGARLSKRRRTHRGASMPPSWPSTGPPSWPGHPGPTSTSERATSTKAALGAGRTGSGSVLAAVAGTQPTATTQGCRPPSPHQSSGEPAWATSLQNLNGPGVSSCPRGRSPDRAGRAAQPGLRGRWASRGAG